MTETNKTALRNISVRDRHDSVMSHDRDQQDRRNTQVSETGKTLSGVMAETTHERHNWV